MHAARRPAACDSDWDGAMASATPAGNGSASRDWPALPFEEWKDTCATLHMWLQIVGKIRLAQTPWLNHSWHVTLYPTSSGLTTSPIPYEERAFQIDFDFVRHQLCVHATDGRDAAFRLEPQSVATFYRRVMEALAAIDVHVRIHTTPNEVPDAIPFEQDETHRAYDREYAGRFWRVLVQSTRVFNIFRT